MEIPIFTITLIARQPASALSPGDARADVRTLPGAVANREP
jgi:hypothetical protein